jgi:hypothetical protein
VVCRIEAGATEAEGGALGAVSASLFKGLPY